MLTRYDRLGASSRVRSLQYIPHLESQGFSISVCPLLDAHYLERLYVGQKRSFSPLLRAYLRRAKSAMSARERFDLVWIEKELFPWLPASFEQLLLTGAPTIVDYDDAIHHRYDQHQSSLVRALLGRKIDVVMRSAGLVIAGNRYLADKALAAGARTIVTVPSAVDVDRYKNKQSLPRPSGCPLTVGWIVSP